MKKYLSLLIVFIMVFSLGTVQLVKAEETAPGNAPTNISPDGKGAMKPDFGKQKEEREGLKKELKDKVAELKDLKMKARGLILNSLEKRIENLLNIVGRINKRIERLTALSVDTTVAKTLVAQAEESITLAKTNIEKVKTDIANDSTKEIIKADITAVKDALKQAHTSLSKVVQELKMKAADKKTDTTTTKTTE